MFYPCTDPAEPRLALRLLRKTQPDRPVLPIADDGGRNLRHNRYDRHPRSRLPIGCRNIPPVIPRWGAGMRWLSRLLLAIAAALVIAEPPVCADELLFSSPAGERDPLTEPAAVFVFGDPPPAPPVYLEEALLTEDPSADLPSADVAALLQRLDELEQRDSMQTTLLESLDNQLKKQKEAEQAKKDADARKPTIKWSAQFQADTYWFNQDQRSHATFGDIDNGEAFRRARFGLFGDYGPTEYRVEMDFALAGRPSFLDVYGGIHDLPVIGRVRVGHFFEPFSLERYTANRFVTFMERALTDQAFAPARNLGVAANRTYCDEQGTWAIGLFRSDSDNFGDDVGDKFESAVTGRVTFLPYYDEASKGSRYVHIGAAYSYRAPNNDLARFRAQPEARLGAVVVSNVPFFVDTGNIPADSYQLVGLEAAWVCGPFSVVSEYMGAPVNSKNSGGLYFDGWYAQASYFLTGEHRPYRKENGTFDRVMPLREFIRYSRDKEIECGPGAWEIAARVSQLDLNDGPSRAATSRT